MKKLTLGVVFIKKKIQRFFWIQFFKVPINIERVRIFQIGLANAINTYLMVKNRVELGDLYP